MFKNSYRTVIFILTAFCFFQPNYPVCADSLMENFIDPTDGMFDAGNWILNQKGFLPIPQIITEPALGYGAGLFLMFFHDSLAARASREEMDVQTEKTNQKAQMIPPSISGIGAFKTENDNWGGGAMHFGCWKEDHIRYLAFLGKVSLNLTFYGKGEDSLLSNGAEYNLEGWGVYQELKFRMADSKVFLGGRLVYFDSKSEFDFSNLPIEIEPWELDFWNVGTGFVVSYDSRDNMFTPQTGVNTTLAAMFHHGSGLMDTVREYQVTEAENTAYWEIKPLPLVLGWRVDGQFSTGYVPFYALPYISLRGIPKARYQDKHVITTEVEARYQVTNRWALMTFGGLGRTSQTIDDFGSGKNRWAGGVGFRYLIARILKLQTGVDVARGPEEWAIYFQIGSGL